MSAAACSHNLSYLFRHCVLCLHIQGETCFSVVLFRSAGLAAAEGAVVSAIVVHDACPDSENLMLLLKSCCRQCLLDGMSKG